MFTSYDAKDTTVTVDGVFITGLGEDMITFEKDEEMFSSTVGAQGDVVMSEIHNPLATITLTVQATSPQKGFLINLATAGVVFPIWCINRVLGERFGGTKARIKNYPSLEYSAEAADREFEIQVFDATVETI